MPTPRHVSLAAINPVETVTPPRSAATYWMRGGRKQMHTEPNGSYCASLFYAESGEPFFTEVCPLLLLQHLEIERLNQHAVHGADGRKSALERGALAGLDRDHKRQRVRRVAWLLDDGTNVDLLVGQ